MSISIFHSRLYPFPHQHVPATHMRTRYCHEQWLEIVVLTLQHRIIPSRVPVTLAELSHTFVAGRIRQLREYP